MLIKVLGPGCPSCKQLHKNVLEAVEGNKNIQVKYITDIAALLEAGIMSSPALLIEDKLVCCGRVPSVEEIKEYIEGNKDKENVPSGGCSCGGNCC